jgi:hypothetical protein
MVLVSAPMAVGGEFTARHGHERAARTVDDFQVTNDEAIVDRDRAEGSEPVFGSSINLMRISVICKVRPSLTGERDMKLTRPTFYPISIAAGTTSDRVATTIAPGSSVVRSIPAAQRACSADSAKAKQADPLPVISPPIKPDCDSSVRIWLTRGAIFWAGPDNRLWAAAAAAATEPDASARDQVISGSGVFRTWD